MMVEHFIDGKTTGVIVQDTAENRRKSTEWMARYNAHYKTKKIMTFKRAK